MEKKRCDYCGNYYDEEFMSSLDNGSLACPECAEEEERNAKEKQEESKKGKE